MYPPDFAVDQHGVPAVLCGGYEGQLCSGRNRGDAPEVGAIAIADVNVPVRCGDQHQLLGGTCGLRFYSIIGLHRFW